MRKMVMNMMFLPGGKHLAELNNYLKSTVCPSVCQYVTRYFCLSVSLSLCTYLYVSVCLFVYYFVSEYFLLSVNTLFCLTVCQKSNFGV